MSVDKKEDYKRRPASIIAVHSFRFSLSRCAWLFAAPTSCPEFMTKPSIFVAISSRSDLNTMGKNCATSGSVQYIRGFNANVGEVRNVINNDAVPNRVPRLASFQLSQEKISEI